LQKRKLYVNDLPYIAITMQRGKGAPRKPRQRGVPGGNRKLVNRILETAERARADGTLKEMRRALSPRQKDVLRCMLRKPRITEAEMAERFGISPTAIPMYKRELLSRLGQPTRASHKYKDLTDQQIGLLLLGTRAKSLEAVKKKDWALHYETKFRQDYLGGDFSWVFLRARYRSEDICSALGAHGDSFYSALLSLPKSEWIVLLNAISPAPRPPRETGLSNSTYHSKLRNLKRHFRQGRVPNPHHRLDSFRELALEVLNTGNPKYILDVAGLDEAGRAIFWERGVNDPPARLDELAKRFGRTTRQNIFILQGKVEANMRAALEDVYPGPVRTAIHEPHRRILEEKGEPLLPLPGPQPARRGYQLKE